MGRLICLQTPTVSWLGEEPFLSAIECAWGLMMLGRQKYIQQSQ